MLLFHRHKATEAPTISTTTQHFAPCASSRCQVLAPAGGPGRFRCRSSKEPVSDSAHGADSAALWTVVPALRKIQLRNNHQRITGHIKWKSSLGDKAPDGHTDKQIAFQYQFLEHPLSFPHMSLPTFLPLEPRIPSVALPLLKLSRRGWGEQVVRRGPL
ncbi:unnamed protein product [Pleuronectes platessa]|uniref:Uncharacterized protein n=1 Tax=Pleuronectes platessa TaxID=8262 RepID=A0A9N7UUX5_PLEPL|nr:unnamed protein product [Pleuronectes platessa]